MIKPIWAYSHERERLIRHAFASYGKYYDFSKYQRWKLPLFTNVWLLDQTDEEPPTTPVENPMGVAEVVMVRCIRSKYTPDEEPPHDPREPLYRIMCEGFILAEGPIPQRRKRS